MNNLGSIPNPDLRSILDQQDDITRSRVNCLRIGTIVSFDPATQSVVVNLVNPSVVFNTPAGPSAIPSNPQLIPIPSLVQVPVFVLSGGGAYIGLPVSAGDTCLVLFNDRDLDPWWSQGTTGAAPNSNRMHSLADGIALVGVRPKSNPVPNLPSDGQSIAFGNASGTLRAALDAFMMATINAVISGTTFNPATIAAMMAAKAKVGLILSE